MCPCRTSRYWCHHDYRGFAELLSDSTVSQPCADPCEDDWARDAFFESFHRAHVKAVPHGEGPVAVALDGTNHLCRCKGNAYCAHGRPKAGKSGVAQASTALVVHETAGIGMHAEGS